MRDPVDPLVMVVEQESEVQRGLALLSEIRRDPPFDPLFLVVDPQPQSLQGCSVQGCPNPPALRPILLLNTRYGTGTPLELEISCLRCPDHADRNVRAYVDRPTWNAIKEVFAAKKLLIPHFSRCAIRFEPLESP